MKTKALSAVVLPLAVLCVYSLWPGTTHTPADNAQGQPATQATKSDKALPPNGASENGGPAQPMELTMAFEQKKIVAEFIGNGRERMKVMLMNKSDTPLRVSVPLGQMFQSDRNTVVTVHPGAIDVGPGKTEELALDTAATRSGNTIGNVPYELSYANLPRIEPLLTLIQSRPELPQGAVQTAVLALTENLSLSSVAKFTLASAPLPSRFNTDAFRAETFDVMEALTVLRELGIKDESLAMTIDPQLKIEAMIDPNARPVAMRYYAIDPEREWDFWRNELLNGEPCTRHYALYGIARFYPDVALEMLPRWARETRTNPVYRLSAVQALADTQRGEALTLLRQLSGELGATTELGKAATGAADYLDYRLAQIASSRNVVAFRNTSKFQTAGF